MNTTADRPRAKSLNPLKALIPFLRPHRGMMCAALIALLIAAGLVTLLAGFIVTFPLIGHATWHAAQAIYPRGRTPADAA